MSKLISPKSNPASKSASNSKRSNSKRKWSLSNLDFRASGYFYIAPFFLLFAAFGLFPVIYNFWVSLHEWDLLGSQMNNAQAPQWNNFENYAAVLTGDQSPRFWNAVFNTFSIFILSSVPQVIIATVLAAFLNSKLRGKTFWRMGVLLPYVVAPVAVAIVFSQIFDQDSGPITGVLNLMGLDPVRWGYDVLPSHLAIASMVNWRWTGYNTLILLAAMVAIPRDLYESASLDGAGAIRQFWSITIPMIRPTMIFVIITSTIGGMQIYTEPKLFDPNSFGGGLNQQYETVVLFLHYQATRQLDYGIGAATAWILFLMILTITVGNYLATKLISSSEVASVKKASKKAAN